jgi:hypothetical protein
MRYQFQWEEWEDPLKQTQIMDEDDDDDEDEEDDYDFSTTDFEKSQQRTKKLGSFKALPTPFGLMSITDHLLASERFDFWIMHTNFPITNEITYNMESIQGVETMNVLTRYRVRFGFPKSGLFNTDETKKRIEAIVIDVLWKHQNVLLDKFDDNTAQKAKEVRDHLDRENGHWALFVLPNGNMEVVKQKCAKRGKKFNDKVDLLRKTHSLIGGVIITSEGD